MRKTLLTLSLVLVIAFTGVCGGGGDDDAREGALKTDESGPSNKSEEIPKGKQPTNVGEHQAANASCGTNFNAAWAEEPKSLADGAKKAKAVVEAEVVEVKAGPDLQIPAEKEPGGVFTVPTSEVVVKVSKSHKGSSDGQTITLFQTGSECQQMDGDPPYKKGESHLLLLTDGPNGKQRTLSPSTRFRTGADGSLTPTHPGPIADEVKGKKVNDVDRELKGA